MTTKTERFEVSLSKDEANMIISSLIACRDQIAANRDKQAEDLGSYVFDALNGLVLRYNDTISRVRDARAEWMVQGRKLKEVEIEYLQRCKSPSGTTNPLYDEDEKGEPETDPENIYGSASMQQSIEEDRRRR